MPADRIAHRARDRCPEAELTQVGGELELRATSAAAAVADIERMARGVAMALREHRKCRGCECLGKRGRERHIQTADTDLSVADAAVDRDHNLRPLYECKASRLIEAMAGDVQSAVLPARLVALEGVEAVLLAGDAPCELGGAVLDAPAMRRDDEDGRARAGNRDDAIVLALPLGARELSVGTVAVRVIHSHG